MMHSFRLRYIVLGLLIYLQNAFCRTCGSEFEDIASKAVLATTVFEGTVVGKSLNISTTELYNATFEVIKTFKGYLPKARRKYMQVQVGVFGPENREQCNTRVDIGSHYIVFLNTSQDASLYTISNFPEQSTKATKRELRKILCDDCAEEVRGRLRPVEQTIKEGASLNLRCKGEGYPPPLIEWYLDDHPLKQSKQVRIRTRKNISRLRIRKTRIDDTGVYQCIIRNALGESVTQQSRVTIESGSAPGTPGTPAPGQPPSHAERCPTQTYCLNGGKCWLIPTPTGKHEYFCKCTANFTGYRCQEKEPDIITQPDRAPIRDARQFDRTMTILGITIGVVLLLGVSIASYCMAKNKRREHFKRIAEKRKKQREEQDSYTNGKHRPLSRAHDRQNENAGEGGMKSHKPEGQFEFMNFKAAKRTRDTGVQTEYEPFFSRSGAHPFCPPADSPCTASRFPQQCSAPADIGAAVGLSSPHSPPSMTHPTQGTLPAFPATLDCVTRKPNATVVSAVVESEPEQRSTRSSPNQSQTSRTESAHLALDSEDPCCRKLSNPESSTTRPLDEPDGDVKLSLGLDPDSQSDYDNQQASDMEVNIESEADVQRLGSSDEEENFPSNFAKLSAREHSDGSDTDSSSAGEEHALFQNLNKKRPSNNSSPRLGRDKKQAAILSYEPPSGDEAERLMEKHSPFNNATSCAFNPYANDTSGSYFGNFGGPNSISSKHYSKQSGYSVYETERKALLFDPDPDATPV